MTQPKHPVSAFFITSAPFGYLALAFLVSDKYFITINCYIFIQTANKIFKIIHKVLKTINKVFKTINKVFQIKNKVFQITIKIFKIGNKVFQIINLL